MAVARQVVHCDQAVPPCTVIASVIEMLGAATDPLKPGRECWGSLLGACKALRWDVRTQGRPVAFKTTEHLPTRI